MGPLVFAHVDELRCFLNSTEGGFDRNFRTAGKSDHSTVGAGTGIHVEQRNSFHRLDCGCDLSNDFEVATLREVRHAFDYFLHGLPISWLLP